MNSYFSLAAVTDERLVADSKNQEPMDTDYLLDEGVASRGSLSIRMKARDTHSYLQDVIL